MTATVLIELELASGSYSEHVPFGSLKNNRGKFIDDEYWMHDITIADPHNMRKQDIQTFLDHVKQRQHVQGPHNAFRFRAYQKRNKWYSALYPGEDTPEAQELPESNITDKPSNGNGTSGEDIAVHLATALESVQAPHLPSAPQPDPAPDTWSSAIDPILIGPGDNHVMVNEATMVALRNRNKGLLGVIPINGPNEGQPVYPVPVAELAHLNSRLAFYNHQHIIYNRQHSFPQ